jgi:hypothetical protein
MAWAIGGIGVAVGGVTLAVVVLMGGGGGAKTKKPDTQVLPATVPADATLAPPVDSGPPKPEAEVVLVHIETIPSGAFVLGEDDGREYGTTPCDVTLVVHDQAIHLVAQAPGYDDRKFLVNPFAQKTKNDVVKIKLIKAEGRAPKTNKILPKTGSGAGSSAGTGTPHNPDFSGDPFAGSAKLPPKQ